PTANVSDRGTRLGSAVGSGPRALPTCSIEPGNATMTNIDERSRRALYERLEHTIGAEGADTLMSMLPPVGWADVATKRDLDALRLATTHDLDVLATDLRGDMTTLATDLRGDMTTLATGLRDEMSTLATGLRDE